MWFDSIDPRDPQQLTSGVSALRFRYDALDNSSLWLWGIWPDGEIKGLEIIPSEKGYLESGGRYVRPVPAGYMAVTFNSRQAGLPSYDLDFRENRFALDGKWDLGAGLWFEAVMQHQDEDLLPAPWSKMLTVGTDYTFSAGNGLYVMLEHMGIFRSWDAWENDEDHQTSAWMASYPVNLTDKISAIGYYSWNTEKYYQYAAFQRLWDDWILHISAFYYPEPAARSSPWDPVQPLAGTGGQVLVIFNH